MRILIGYPTDIPELMQHKLLPGREAAGDEIVCFGAGYRHIDWKPTLSWNEILAACPSGWRPDLYLHWKIEYAPVPQGLEDADCLTVGVLGDWNLGGHALRAVGDLFDVLVADQNGTEALRRAGYSQTLHAQLWGYDPMLHRRLPGVVRDLDIVMIGSFNHAIHAERFRTLARAAALSRQYTILFSMGLYGEEYTRLLNRARIVFNYAVRGEINMRAYEAPACGALLFQEAHNTEIASLYKPGEELILYHDEDLETLLEHYLTHEAQREAIAEAGYRAVQSHTYARHLGDLLSAIEASGFQRSSRPFLSEDITHRRIRTVTQWLQACEPALLPVGDRLLREESTRVQEIEKAYEDTAHSGSYAGHHPSVSDADTLTRCKAELAGLRAALIGAWAECQRDPSARIRALEGAAGLAAYAVQVAPNLISARFNLAFLYRALGHTQKCVKLLEAALDALHAHAATSPSPAQNRFVLGGCYIPRQFLRFDVERERIEMMSDPGSMKWSTAMMQLLRFHSHTTLAEIALENHDATNGLYHAEHAADCAPDCGVAHTLLGIAGRQRGRTEAAEEALRHAIARQPFLLDAWQQLAELCLETNRLGEAKQLVDKISAILDACPVYAPHRAAIDSLLIQIGGDPLLADPRVQMLNAQTVRYQPKAAAR